MAEDIDLSITCCTEPGCGQRAVAERINGMTMWNGEPTEVVDLVCYDHTPR